MSRRRFSTRVRVVAALGAFVLVAPSLLPAQVGGLIRGRIGAAAEQRVTGSDQATPPVITPDVVTKLIKGLQASAIKLVQRDSVEKLRDAQMTRLVALQNSSSAAVQRYNESLEKNRQCRDSVFSLVQDQRRAEQDKKTASMGNNPAELARLSQIAMQYSGQLAQAQQRGDTAEARRLTAAMQVAITGIDPVAALHGDTVKVNAACGLPPAPPAAIVAVQREEAEQERLTNQVRDLEAAASKDGETASGLSNFTLVREKVDDWLARSSEGGTAPRGYSSAENSALSARRADLEKLARPLMQRS